MEGLKWWLLLLVAVMFSMSGCASADLATWSSHPVHFASGDHLAFSVRSHDAGEASITEQDIALATREEWWGRLVPEAPPGPPMDLTGRWRGTWTARGLFGDERVSDAEVTFAQYGTGGTGRVRLGDTIAVTAVPWELRQAGSFGVPVVYRIDGSDAVARDQYGSAFKLTFTRVGDTLYGNIANGPVVLVLQRD